MNILGISCYYHDSAAVLVKNGKVVAACEEERLSRVKHDSSFPKKAIDFCLKAGGISSKDLDYAVFYEKPFRKFHRILISSLSTFPHSYRSFREASRIWLTQKLWIREEIALSLNIDIGKVLFCQHHSSHQASCFFTSPFKRAAILTIDGVGEWTTASFGIGEGDKVKILKELHFPASLGLLYSAFTAFLGYEVNEGEWKVMGLAPYGKPIYSDKIMNLVDMKKDGSFSLDFSYFSFQYSDTKSFSDKLVRLFGKAVDPSQSHKITRYSADLAASIQDVSEKIILNMARALAKETKEKYLCLAGGVALNSVANYKILKSGIFENIFIQPAAGDSGAAMGSALYLSRQVLGKKNKFIMDHAYWGSEYSNEDIEKFLKSKNVKFKKFGRDKLIRVISDKIQQGKVVGWMQGRLEWGPRALGNRSILADARNPKMKDIINEKVKFREAFRPFAPSVLAEHAGKVFDLPANYMDLQPLKYMLFVVPVRKEWRRKVPAITHIDNSARPQIVKRQDNPLYYDLISQFYKKTKVPLVLNTSFNLRGEAIVENPEDAYSTFIRSGIDVLVIGNMVCEKKI